jgi:hypothetical protein
MRNITRFCGLVYAAAIAAGLVGCGGEHWQPAASLPSPALRLPGKWQGQMVVYEDAVAGKLTPEQIAALSQQRLGLEFAADGSMVTTGEIQGQSFSTPGHWQVIGEEGDLLKIQSTEDGGQTKDVHIEFEGSDIFYIPLKTEVAELGAMRFERMR